MRPGDRPAVLEHGRATPEPLRHLDDTGDDRRDLGAEAGVVPEGQPPASGRWKPQHRATATLNRYVEGPATAQSPCAQRPGPVPGDLPTETPQHQPVGTVHTRI